MSDYRPRFGPYLRGTLTFGDFLILNIAYLITSMVAVSWSAFDSRLVWLLVNISFVPSVLFFSGIHNLRIMYADRVVLNAFKSTVCFGAVLVVLFYIFRIDHIGWGTGLLFIGLFFLLLSVWWLLSRECLKKARRMGLNFKRVAIVGDTAASRSLYSRLQSDEGYGYRLMGIFDNNLPQDDIYSFGGAYRGSLSQLDRFVRENRIDQIYYTLDAEDHAAVTTVMTLAEEIGAEFTYVPKINPLLSGNFMQSSLGDLPVFTHRQSPLHSLHNRLAKRAFDLLITVPFLAMSPLIFIPVAIAVKISSPGPVFFRQRRTGIRGTDFMCYKFRTMRQNDDADVRQATENDPRKTKIGNFLRRTSIDELPQFVNVLLGQMSVVGPRPHMVAQTEQYSALIDKYMVRHAIKPGITGWAQVNGYRGGTRHLWQMEKRVEYDVWYIRNWNLFLDLKIVVLTIFNALRKDKNAY